MTTDPIVVQKKIPGHSCESTIASPTVTMNTITSIIMLHTMRGVRFPLKTTETNELISKCVGHLLVDRLNYPKFTKIFSQFRMTFGICADKVRDDSKYVL